MTYFSATYSPDDNKLRISASSRLDKELYERVRGAGFIWAPKQEIFVAPMWTPSREDLCIELAGEVGDEDTSLIDRAEQRAERFEDYSDKRGQDAERARSAVSAITDGIPLGQPILVGHHSEKRARKDAEKIENGMRKAVKMWETSKYWQERAAGAIAHAKYKELPAVRHRRIKSIEADKRKQERSKAEAEKWLKAWSICEAETDPEKQMQLALRIADACWLHMPKKEGDTSDNPTASNVLNNNYPTLYVPRTIQEVFDRAKKAYPATMAHCDRWIAHYDNRLAYEKAMLNAALGVAEGESSNGIADRFNIEVGGKVLVSRDEWLIVLKVNKVKGVINSVTTQAPRSVHWSKTWKYSIEEVKDYEKPTEELAEAVKKANALPPICNYPGEGFVHMTEEEYKRKKDPTGRGRGMSDFSYVGTVKATETTGAHRVKQLPGPNWSRLQVFITDAKRKDPPGLKKVESLPAPEPAFMPPVRPSAYKAPERTEFDDMKDSLKQGVKVVSAPQLFPTPSGIAEQVIELADIQQFDRVLEPSAGTGSLIDAIHAVSPECGIHAIEINHALAKALEGKSAVTCADFLEINPDEFGAVDRVVMNPPFENASDVRHVKHALKFLRPGGRLVAVVANGPRQQKELKPLASEWISLPKDSFKVSGTGVNAAIIVIDKVA